MRSKNLKYRLLIGVAIALFFVFKRCSQREENPYTGRMQTISMSANEEIAIGLQSAPQMAQQHGGLHSSNQYQALVDNVGNKLINNSIAKQTPYKYEFHLLADPNAEDQLAGVLGHEIGHVLGRHSAERIAESEYWQGLATAGSVGADMGGLVSGIGQNTLLTNGRDDELESDDLGVRFMLKAGYNPEEMIGVMEILKDAAGPNRVPEFQSTHPDPDNRIEKIREAIKKHKNQ